MRTLDRIGAFTGAGYVILGSAAGGMAGDAALPDNGTGQQYIDAMHRLADSTMAQVGISLELLAIAFWIVFVGYVYVKVRPAGWLAGAALVGGIVSIAAKYASLAPILALYGLRDQISPEAATILSQIGLVAFLIDILPAGIFVLCASAAALTTHTLNRFVCWAGLAIGAYNIVFALITGPRVEGAFSPAYLLILLWMLVASIWFGLARTRTTPTVEPAGGPAVAT